MPQILKDQGISVVEVKNQNIFIMSPIIQLASTETLRPLLVRVLALAKSWGMGSVASTESPT